MHIKLIVGLCVMILAASVRANITYVMNQYPSYQTRGGVNYDLIGTITTDGTIGALSPANILSWHFTTTPDDGSGSTTFTSGTAFSSTVVTGQVIATATEIQIPRFTTITPSVINKLALGDTNPALTASPSFLWQTGAFLIQPFVAEQFGFEGTRTDPLGNPWLKSSNAGTTLNLPAATGSIVVATVPEPASLSLLGLAVAGLLGRRRRNA